MLRVTVPVVTPKLTPRLAPGRTVYVLNCGSDDDAPVVGGHPRLNLDAIKEELGDLFEVVSARPGVYDVEVSGGSNAPQWNKDHQGVRSHFVVMRRRGEREAEAEGDEEDVAVGGDAWDFD